MNKNRYSFFRQISAFVIASAIFVSFQNCTKVNFQTADGSVLPSNAANAAAATPVPGATPAVTPQCESSGKLEDPVTHSCVEFACKSFVALAPVSPAQAMTFEVPARTTDGICYTVKLMDAIAGSSSSLTTVKDQEVISANHDTHVGTWNPYQLGKANVEFLMHAGGGARQVKLSGSGDGAKPITVDNFVLVGFATKAQGLALNSSYNSYGTIDSTVDGSNIIFRNVKLPLANFGPGGTSTIGTLDITTQVSTEESYLLDVRALDCGGWRELSDIYLLFQ